MVRITIGCCMLSSLNGSTIIAITLIICICVYLCVHLFQETRRRENEVEWNKTLLKKINEFTFPKEKVDDIVKKLDEIISIMKKE